MKNTKFNVLIIDDDAVDRENIKRLLSKSKKQSFYIFEANNIADGLDLYLHHSIDCILLDYLFPDSSGLELISLLKKHFSTKVLPIVVLTGHGNEGVVVEFLRLGALDYLKKEDLNAIGLEKAIVNCIKRYKLHQQLNKLTQNTNYMLNHDELTKVANRRKFKNTLKRYMKASKRYHRLSALLFCDLDKFKYINDTLGHEIGDLLLKKVATRLCDTVRKSDLVARLSGDEFVIILDEINNKSDLHMVASHICQAIANPFIIKGNVINITISIGIVLIPSSTDNPVELVNRADKAMYHAKNSGANGYQFGDA